MSIYQFISRKTQFVPTARGGEGGQWPILYVPILLVPFRQEGGGGKWEWTNVSFSAIFFSTASLNPNFLIERLLTLHLDLDFDITIDRFFYQKKNVFDVGFNYCCDNYKGSIYLIFMLEKSFKIQNVIIWNLYLLQCSHETLIKSVDFLHTGWKGVNTKSTLLEKCGFCRGVGVLGPISILFKIYALEFLDTIASLEVGLKVSL